MKVWLVGRYISGTSAEHNIKYELNGIVSSLEKALVACTKPVHFYAEMELDKVVPDEPTIPLPVVYPITWAS